MKDWLNNFPKVKIIQPGLKFPQTRNGVEIFETPSYKKRTELVTITSLPGTTF
jgi:hypothetical protein